MNNRRKPMYAPPAFKNNDIQQLHEFMQKYSFSTVISASPSISVSHLPLILLPKQGKYGTLVGHMAKANTHWKEFDEKKTVLCIFHGPHAYISPSWYKNNRPDVPTWNYAVVHASGTPKLVQDKSSLQAIIDLTINYFDPSAHIPDDFKQTLFQYIVGFEIEIETLIGKFKLGQNRSPEDQLRLLEGLSKQADNDSKQLTDFIKYYYRTPPCA